MSGFFRRVPQHPVQQWMSANSSYNDFEAAPNSIHSFRAPGPDNIPIELIKHSGLPLKTRLFLLFLRIWGNYKVSSVQERRQKRLWKMWNLSPIRYKVRHPCQDPSQSPADFVREYLPCMFHNDWRYWKCASRIRTFRKCIITFLNGMSFQDVSEHVSPHIRLVQK